MKASSTLAAKTRMHPPSKGMTLIELVIVMVLVGALAFIAIPRLNSTSMQVVPVAEQIAAEIRYAQSLSMTRSEAHTFSIGGGTYSISNAGGSVPLSNGDSVGTYGDVIADAAAITFSPRFGRPDAGASINVSGGGSTVTILVEGETGYARIQE